MPDDIEVRMTLRLPADLKSILEARAKRNRRSLNSELVEILDFVVEVEEEEHITKA